VRSKASLKISIFFATLRQARVHFTIALTDDSTPDTHHGERVHGYFDKNYAKESGRSIPARFPAEGQSERNYPSWQ